MSLEGVPGQPRAKRYLQRMVSNGHVSHAILFVGMNGVGKAPVAMQFAKLLNCLSPRNVDSCDSCVSCRKLEDGNHPDLVWITKEGAFIKLDQIRALRERLRFRPFEGRWRVIVIQNSQNLNEEAGNSLLKLLEEPPRQNVFVLTAPEPQMLLPTIVSRCSLLRFQPLDNATIENYLVNEKQLPVQRARDLARLAEGSRDRADWFLEESRITRWEEVLRSVTHLGELSMLDFFSMTAEWAQKAQDLEQDLECIKLWIRDLVLSRLLTDYRPFFKPDSQFLSLIQRTSVEHIIRLYDEVEKSLYNLRLNANKQLTLEGVCLAIKDGLYGQSGRYSIPQGR